LQAQSNNIKKLSKHQINQSKLKKSQIKVCLVLQKRKEGKNSYQGYPMEFAGSTQILKKILEHQIYQSGRNFFQISMLSTLKKKKRPKIGMGATRRELQA
jgi:hypothetical protein